MSRFFSWLLLAALLSSPLFGQAVAVLRTGDVFDMRLSGVPAEFAQEYALQYTVGQGGTINVPLVGEIKAAGLTSTELERALQNRLVAGKIFQQPTVIINPVPSVRLVFVTGGVKTPGRVPWTADLTLHSAIGSCGGLSDFGSSKGVRVIRDSKQAGSYNLDEITRDPAKDPKLLPGDQIWVRGE